MANNIIGTVGVGAQSVKPDWNQNDPNAKDYIKNRPGGYAVAPSVEITWDGNVDGKETLNVYAGITMVKIADEAPQIEKFAVESHGSPKALISLELTYDSGKSETKQAEIELVANDDFWIGENESPNCTVLGVMADSANIRGITFAKGLWFSRIEVSTPSSSAKAVVVRGISTTDGGVKKFPESSMPDEVLSRISNAQNMAETAQDTASEATSTAQTAQSTANAAKTTAETAQNTANTAVKPTKQNENNCWYSMYNKYAENKTTVMALGSTGGPALSIKVNEKCPSVAFIPPTSGHNQADFEFRRVTSAYRHPLITGIGGIVVYSSTPNSTKKFKITVDDTGTISATEVTN